MPRYLEIHHQKVFCLVEAPSKEVAIAVQREAHSSVADEVIEVQ